MSSKARELEITDSTIRLARALVASAARHGRPREAAHIEAIAAMPLPEDRYQKRSA